MAYLKHDGNNGNGKRRKVAKPDSPAEPVKVVVTGPESGLSHSTHMQHDLNYVHGMDGIEASLDWIAKGINKLTSGEHNVSLTSGYGSEPIMLTLAENDCDDTMDRFVTAVERIADSLSRLAGLSRPRLESWHEQEEYEPRNKNIACDGGAPGPKSQQG